VERGGHSPRWAAEPEKINNKLIVCGCGQTKLVNDPIFWFLKVIIQTGGLKLKWLDCTVKDLKSKSVKRRRKKPKAVIQKAALFAL
jgi:hypothetical protein